MIQKNWKLGIGILIGLIIILTAVRRFTRSVSPFSPPADRQMGHRGSLDGETAQKLQAVLDEDVNREKVPGLQAYIRTSDGLTWMGASGTTDLARRHPLQPDDVLRVGSVTKSFTAVIILKLVEEGRLHLDDPIDTWFPLMPDASAITVRQLLNHTSGIPEIIPQIIMKSIIPSTYWNREDLLNIIANYQLLFSPGSRYEYSNSNYILLGYIAEDVAGKPFVQLLHEHIIDPLKLEHTYFIPFEPAPATLIPGFERDLAHIPGMLDISPDNTSWATGAFTSGAMASTAEDLGIFFDHLMAGALLSPPTMKEMITFIDAPNSGFPAQNGYGLGLMQLDVDGQELIGHVGQFMGSVSIAMYAPAGDYVIIVTSNLSNPDLVAVLADLQNIIK